jgi:hypothetical protein
MRHVVGRFEVQVYHILELVRMWSEEQHPRTSPLLT